MLHTAYVKVGSVTVSPPPVCLPIIPFHLPQPTQCLSKRIWVGTNVEVHPACPFFFPWSFINSGTPQLGTDPQRGTVWLFSGSRKLITAINCEHQQSAPSPAVSPWLRGPTKCWFRAKAERRQWQGSPPAGSPSLWQLNKNQCKLLIGSLIIDAVFTTIQGARAEKRQGWNCVCV